MNENKPNNRELLRRIAKLSAEAQWTTEETREALSEAGVREEDVTEPIVRLVTRLKRESPFHWKAKAEAMRQELLERVHSRVKAEVSGLTRAQLLDKVKQALRRLPTPAAEQYALAFRKFEGATEDDLCSMLEELAIVEDLERPGSEI